MAYKEYKKVIKNAHIDNAPNFTDNMTRFLKKNQDIKILEVIVHKSYHVTIIYQELVEV